MKTLLSILLAISFLTAHGQEYKAKKYIKSIDKEELRNHLEFLASDECEGRETGKKGQKLAADYIRETLEGFDLNGSLPGIDNYFQKFNLIENRLDSFFIISNNTRLDCGIDFRMGSMKEKFAGTINSDLVFVGFGLESDYKNKDVNGKVVIYFEGQPDNLNQKSDQKTLSGYYNDTNEKLETASKHGACCAIQIKHNEQLLKAIMEAQSSMMRSKMDFPEKKLESSSNDFTSEIMVHKNDAAELLGMSNQNLEKIYDKLNRGKVTPKIPPSTMQINAYRTRNEISTENVIAYCEGGARKDELIVVVAHYDHLGKTDNEIFNGADDNASGTAALLEIAEAFSLAKKNGEGPERSILFLAVSAEEKGLLGSQYFIDHPAFPLENISVCINMDMLGRADFNHSDNPDYVYVYNSEAEDSELFNQCKVAAELTSPDLSPIYQFKGKTRLRGGSDHMSFDKAGIPVLYYYTGTHMDYHKPSDTSEKINYDNLANITKLIFTTIWEIAN